MIGFAIYNEGKFATKWKQGRAANKYIWRILTGTRSSFSNLISRHEAQPGLVALIVLMPSFEKRSLPYYFTRILIVPNAQKSRVADHCSPLTAHCFTAHCSLLPAPAVASSSSIMLCFVINRNQGVNS